MSETPRPSVQAELDGIHDDLHEAVGNVERQNTVARLQQLRQRMQQTTSRVREENGLTVSQSLSQIRQRTLAAQQDLRSEQEVYNRDVGPQASDEDLEQRNNVYNVIQSQLNDLMTLVDRADEEANRPEAPAPNPEINVTTITTPQEHAFQADRPLRITNAPAAPNVVRIAGTVMEGNGPVYLGEGNQRLRIERSGNVLTVTPPNPMAENLRLKVEKKPNGDLELSRPNAAPPANPNEIPLANLTVSTDQPRTPEERRAREAQMSRLEKALRWAPASVVSSFIGMVRFMKSIIPNAIQTLRSLSGGGAAPANPELQQAAILSTTLAGLVDGVRPLRDYEIRGNFAEYLQPYRIEIVAGNNDRQAMERLRTGFTVYMAHHPTPQGETPDPNPMKSYIKELMEGHPRREAVAGRPAATLVEANPGYLVRAGAALRERQQEVGALGPGARPREMGITLWGILDNNRPAPIPPLTTPGPAPAPAPAA